MKFSSRTKFSIYNYAPYVFLIAGVFAAYGNVYKNAFLLDDEFLIIKNTYLRFWGDLPKLLTLNSTAGAGGFDAFYRPLQGLLYFIVYQLSRLSTFGFHFLNVALHAGNAVLVFVLGQRLGFNRRGAFAAALLWAIHPVHTEAVTYMSATADPLYALFCLGGLCVLLPDFSLPRMVWGCLLFALALLAKETAIVFPLLAMLCLFAVSKQRWQARFYLKTWPLWAVAGVYLLLRFTVLQMDNLRFYHNPNPYSEDLVARVLTFIATLPTYFRLLVWPNDLHMSRNFPVFISLWNWPVLAGLFALFGAAGIVGRTIFTRGKSFLALSFGISWFAIAHVLHTGVFLPVNALMLEHWLYLPSVGLALGLAESVVTVGSSTGLIRLADPASPKGYAAAGARRWIPAFAGMTPGVVVSAFALLLGSLTYRQNTFWREPIVFYETILRYGDRSMNAYNNLGMAYAVRGDFDRAIEMYRAAIALSDTFAQPHHNIARVLLSMPEDKQNIPEAIAELERAIEINPKFFQSYVSLAEIFSKLGNAAKSEAYQRKAEEILQGR